MIDLCEDGLPPIVRQCLSVIPLPPHSEHRPPLVAPEFSGKKSPAKRGAIGPGWSQREQHSRAADERYRPNAFRAKC